MQVSRRLITLLASLVIGCFTRTDNLVHVAQLCGKNTLLEHSNVFPLQVHSNHLFYGLQTILAYDDEVKSTRYLYSDHKIPSLAPVEGG